MMPLPDAYAGLEPAEVWRHFGDLNAIPRTSFNEQAAMDHLRRTAELHGAAWKDDARGNVVVYVPASAGRESQPAVAVQAHLDMVCEKRPEIEHDFLKDPIRPRRDDGWIYATGTTLGADNGIGAACALALLTSPELSRPPLELIFTVEEETGLHGAANLEPSLVSARKMVNLDSEDPSVLTIGCAGGAGSILHLPLDTVGVVEGHEAVTLSVSGLKGGHSGVQIHEHLANAIKILTQCLFRAKSDGVDFQIASLQGGNAHNAIARDARALLLVPADQVVLLDQALEAKREVLDEVWSVDEPGLRIETAPAERPAHVLSQEQRDRLLALLSNLPHGVLKLSHTFPGKVDTSSNLAQVRTTEDEIEIGTSTRSFWTEQTERVQKQIREMADLAGARVDVRDGYPGWEPDPHSELLKQTVAAYERTFGDRPHVEVIHAGLECGVIAARLPGMEAISFGPRIMGAHTPEERVEIATVERTWKLLTALLAERPS
jgi:dipeptidase D